MAVVVRCNASYFVTVYRRLLARRGHKRPIIAVYYMLRHQQLYQEYCATSTSQRCKELLQQLQIRVEQLGYQVQLLNYRVNPRFSKQF